MTARVLVAGEALIDIVHRTDGSVDRHPGGSPLNVAIGLARLGHPVEYAARFAPDDHGELIRAHLAREKLLTLTPGTDHSAKTSTAKATLDATGAATYEFDVVWDVGEAIDDEPIGHLHTGSIAATMEPGSSDVLRAARYAHGSGTVSYDPNARPQIMRDSASVRDRIEAFIRLSDVVKASDEDIAWLYDGEPCEDVVTRWATMGPSLIVITRGKAGSLGLVTGTGEHTPVPAGTPVVVDTVGAGDSFMSGLISGLLDAGLLGSPAAGNKLRHARLADVLPALTRASACAAVTVSRAGANPPTRAELGI